MLKYNTVDFSEYQAFVKVIEERHPDIKTGELTDDTLTAESTGTLVTAFKGVCYRQRVYKGQVLTQAMYQTFPTVDINITYTIAEDYSV